MQDRGPAKHHRLEPPDRGGRDLLGVSPYLRLLRSSYLTSHPWRPPAGAVSPATSYFPRLVPSGPPCLPPTPPSPPWSPCQRAAAPSTTPSLLGMLGLAGHFGATYSGPSSRCCSCSTSYSSFYFAPAPYCRVEFSTRQTMRSPEV